MSKVRLFAPDNTVRVCTVMADGGVSYVCKGKRYRGLMYGTGDGFYINEDVEDQVDGVLYPLGDSPFAFVFEEE